eukprot:jgi/Picre1/27835/NNA_000799.t1
MAPGDSRTDEVLRTLSENGQVSIIVVDGTRLVQEACTRHNTAPTASAALGRAILGTLMMSCFRGEGEKTQVTFKGDGPFGMIQVVSESSGQVKGLIGNPEVNFPLRDSDNKLDVSQGVGRGVLSVVRSLPFTDKAGRHHIQAWFQSLQGKLQRILPHIWQILNKYNQHLGSVFLSVEICRLMLQEVSCPGFAFCRGGDYCSVGTQHIESRK